MKATAMRDKSENEIQKQLNEWRQHLAVLHRERFTSESTNVREARIIRKDIARSLTVLGQLRKPQQPAQKASTPTKRPQGKEK